MGFVPLPSIYRTVFLLQSLKKKNNFVLQEFFIQPELFHVSILAYHRHCHPLGQFVRRQRVCKVLYSLLSMVCSVGWKSVRAMKLHWTRNIFTKSYAKKREQHSVRHRHLVHHFIKDYVNYRLQPFN